MNKAWWVLGLVVLALGAWWLLRPLSTLAKIQRLVPAPVQKDAVNPEQWQTFETEAKVFVPEEFKMFIAQQHTEILADGQFERNRGAAVSGGIANQWDLLQQAQADKAEWDVGIGGF
jgi:hypothetical protein